MMNSATECQPRWERRLRRHGPWVLIAVGVVFILAQGRQLRQSQIAERAAARARDDQLRRAELIIVSAPTALIVCGEHHRITICNPAAEELFGYTHEELIGQDISILLPPEFRAEHGQVFHRALKDAIAGPDNHMMRIVGVTADGMRKDGTRVELELAIRVIKYGGHVEFITSMRKPDLGDELRHEHLPIPELEQRAK